MIFRYLLFSLLSISAFSQGGESFSQIREDITKRVENIVSIFDEEARVDVTFITKNRSSKDSPFLIIGPATSNDPLAIKEADIIIYTKKDPKLLPENLKGQIQNRMREYTFPVSYSYKFIEQKQVNDPEGKSEPSLTKFQTYLLFSFGLLTLIFAISGSYIVRFFPKFLSSRNVTQGFQGNGIPESLEAIRKSIENISNSSAPNSANGNSLKIDMTNSKDNLFVQMNIDGIHQILMDCYWTEEDTYASFVWDRIPVSMKVKLIEKEKKLVSYANYISQLKGEDYGFISEPYYLFPLSLENINNVSLSELAKRYNSIFRNLPKIRMNALNLSATRKKELISIPMSQKEIDLELNSINWKEFESSELRNLPSTNVFYFKDEWEEELFFQDTTNIDFSLVRTFPSLVWLTFLDDYSIRKILNNYSAKELALAWTGPVRSLKKLEKTLDKEKVELLHAYIKKVVPSRKSKVFISILNSSYTQFDEILEDQASA